MKSPKFLGLYWKLNKLLTTHFTSNILGQTPITPDFPQFSFMEDSTDFKIWRKWSHGFLEKKKVQPRTKLAQLCSQCSLLTVFCPLGFRRVVRLRRTSNDQRFVAAESALNLPRHTERDIANKKYYGTLLKVKIKKGAMKKVVASVCLWPILKVVRNTFLVQNRPSMM